MKYLTIFTDASFHESGAAGYAFYIRDETTILKGGYEVPWLASRSTEVEMFAMCAAIHHAIDHLSHQSGDCIVAATDCTHVIESFDPQRRIHPSENNMRMGVFRALLAAGLTLRFKHVRAHTGADDKRSYVNRYCDQAAKACQRKRKQALDSSKSAKLPLAKL